MQKITPNVWFNGNAKEAVDFYASVFPNTNIKTTSHYPKIKKKDWLTSSSIWLAKY